jgi:hypothetical protein
MTASKFTNATNSDDIARAETYSMEDRTRLRCSLVDEEDSAKR